MENAKPSGRTSVESAVGTPPLPAPHPHLLRLHLPDRQWSSDRTSDLDELDNFLVSEGVHGICFGNLSGEGIYPVRVRPRHYPTPSNLYTLLLSKIHTSV